MSTQISRIITSRSQSNGPAFSAKSLELQGVRDRASPIMVLDNFRVSEPIFGPHPHAGFSAITYVLEDSIGGLRSRDSLGNDIVVGPGGIVWSQAGSGMLHEELPAAPGRELHGLQIFVNLASKNKLIAPQVLSLAPSQVPEWRNDMGDYMRVVVGSFGGVKSPLVPAEDFDLLDVHLRDEIAIDLRKDCNALVYALNGGVVVKSDGVEQALTREQAVAISGCGRVTLETSTAAHILVLIGLDSKESVVMQGPFIMNHVAQIEAAHSRYSSGAMGRLEPLFRS